MSQTHPADENLRHRRRFAMQNYKKILRLARIYAKEHIINTGLAQKYETIRREKPPRVRQLSVACGLVFGGGEVEEGFIVTSFMLPVAYLVFNAVWFLGSPGEEILFMIDEQLKVFLGSVEGALSTVEPLGFS